jgi:hypothetical protein
MTAQRRLSRLLAIVVAGLFVAHGAPVLADESSVRERHPSEITRTPTPTPEGADGDVSVSETQVPPTATSTPPEVSTEEAETSTPPTEEATSPPIVSIASADTASSDAGEALVRPKPTPRSFNNPAARPPTAEPEPTTPRLDDPVLRWLPEIMASAAANGVPAELIAGIIRVESNGNPNIISPDGARGLMQIMPDQLLAQGIYEDYWHDPATNIMAGGYELLERSWAYGSWEGAVSSYFGFGCDVFGTCTEVYVAVVFGWAAYYAPIIANPLGFGFAVLPADWVPPPIAPFVEAAPLPIEEPPPPPAPTETSETPTPTATPTSDPLGSPSAEPTDVPTDVPTDTPTEEPTAVPTDVPTEGATEVPTDPPTEEPPPDASGGDSD